MPARLVFVLIPALLLLGYLVLPATAQSQWSSAWPDTDFENTSIDLADVLSGGPPKDGIPSIDDPVFASVAEVYDLPDIEPVISVEVGGEARAYPLRILMWHEIVNDTVNGVPLTITFCPLCNTSIVFERTLDGVVYDFGTTGKLRNSDLVIYDRQTESWWQQFTGTAIVGVMNETQLTPYPSRLESFALFKQRHPNGMIQIPNDGYSRDYGANPYVGYDSRQSPYAFFDDELPTTVPPLSRVVRVNDQVWSLMMVRSHGRIEEGDLVITWEPGQASALDAHQIASSVDIGNVVVQRWTEEGLVDAVYTVDFAFAFHTFYPDSEIRTGTN
ncbi:MAG: DUF3179 domain-containing protein [Alphaproteobacteria bacterium]|nr:DUF3179 domain-containing protein [Rhodospirillaceae bacterium]MBT6510768.1 DUF3179 domain-containing protein [Rhodospirillaceae bacterium]MBT7614330.1 DUF3179 domain-containing protein [Rhodospirillaceae bacterium]MBT7648448.1 DUF3179 domain-containing protein [Rhodospirillaceae bacterium]MDG2480257.1 DUF3179 domain-containing protein [Alphaproteobacteria bacterium]